MKSSSGSKSISAFFERLGAPLHDKRKSWGARSENFVLLRCWKDRFTQSGATEVLGSNALVNLDFGSKERIEHLKLIWAGGFAGYVVTVEAIDPSAKPREIKSNSHDSEHVFPINVLVTEPDGSIWAELGQKISVNDLEEHAKTHRPFPSPTPFPRQPSKFFRDTSAPYVKKIPELREFLIEVAEKKETKTYGEVRSTFDLGRGELRHAMDRLGHACLKAGEPILTSLIVAKDSQRCSEGFFKEFHREDVQERQDCYVFWAKNAGSPTTDTEKLRDFRDLAACFSLVETRPEQSAFRRRVFFAQKGRCYVSGCDISKALDAAHKKGRDWRQGHNSADDGLLLRKDLHALYDAGLMTISSDGSVDFDHKVLDYYKEHCRKGKGKGKGQR